MRISSSTSARRARLLAALCVAAVMACGAMAPRAAAQVTSGSYVGNGLVGRTIGGLGFPPVAVIVKGDLAEPAIIRLSTMPGQTSKSLADNDAFITTGIRSLTADGFTIGTDPAVNSILTSYEWVAFGAVPGHVVSGSYLGDGQDPHTITGIGFRPAVVVVVPAENRHATFKTASMVGPGSVPFRDDSMKDNRILSLDADGFTVTNDNHVNDSGRTFHFVAISDAVAQTESYVGTGVLDAHLLEHKPHWIVVKSEENAEGVHRPSSLGGTVTHRFNPDATLTGAIIGITDGSFTVGSADQVNKSGDTYHYVSFREPSADIGVTKGVDEFFPRELDEITYTINVNNTGPAIASDVTVTDVLPGGLTYLGDSASVGSYSSDTGVWSVGALGVGEVATLRIAASVDDGTGGETITNVAEVVPSALSDPNANNDSDSVDITVDDRVEVLGADIRVSKSVNDAFPTEAETVTFTVNVGNDGPLDATGVIISDPLPAGLTYLTHEVTHGLYTPLTGAWQVGSLVNGAAAELSISALVNVGTSGTTIMNVAKRTSQGQIDHVPGNDADSASVTVQDPALEEVRVELVEIDPTVVRPGDPRTDVVVVRLINASASQQQLESITFADESEGDGTTAEMDASWANATLQIRNGPSDVEPQGWSGTPLPRGTGPEFDGGLITFDGIGQPIGAGDTLRVVLKAGASLAARDGDLLRAGILEPSHVVFENTVSPSAQWPLVPETGLTVDGMSRAALSIEPVEAMVFQAGTTRNVALAFVVPPNGYDTDTLQRLDIVVAGSATYPDDIVGMELFVDNGDAVFDPSSDTLLGPLSFTGARWERTGLSVFIPLTGRRLFVTVDIAENAMQGATLRLGLPSAPDVALGMASDNDGPIDQIAQNPFTQTVSVEDRILMGATAVASGDVAPGAQDVPFLTIAATNTYADLRTVTSLTLTNLSVGQPPATPAELDAEVASVVLRIDGDDDGELDDLATDPIAGTATFVDGDARFDGLGWSLPSETTRTLFVIADVAVRSTDGDILAIGVQGPSNVSFDVPSAVVATWPLDSGARWRVDGMVADQIDLVEVPPSVLAAGDASSLALDVTLPPNGYLDDILRGLEILNLGSASDVDFDAVHLWRDGGDGAFDPLGDDVDLGAMTWFTGVWRSAFLSDPITSDGVRLFVAVDVADTPTDSATVRFAIPTAGVTVESANDGPIDGAVFGQNTLLLSGSPLVASLTLGTSRSTIGQGVTAMMSVRNVGTEDIVGVSPTALTPAGAGSLSVLSGPTPPTLDLAPDSTGVFTWTLQAETAGQVRLSGGADGTGSPSTIPRSAIQTTSNLHTILVPVTDADLFAVENMPFAIGLGETNVVPLSLTFDNPAGDDASIVQLSSLRIRLEDETGAGIVPADQLTRVAVLEGANVYLDKTVLETTGSEVDLTLSTPVLVHVEDPVTLGLHIDISPTAVSPTFRVAIADSTWFVTSDAIGGGNVAVHLLGGSYPIESGLGRLVSEADLLNVSAPSMTAASVGPGQTTVPLMRLDLLNPSGGDASADVVVGGIEVSLRDATGSLLSVGDRLSRIRVSSATQTFLDRPTSDADSTMALSFSPPVTVPVDAVLQLLVEGDVAATPTPGSVQLHLGASGTFEAWDETSGDPVAVVYETDPITGGQIDIQLQATALRVAGESAMPATVPIGATGVPTLSLSLRHPSSAGTAPARLDSLVIDLLDDSRDPLDGDAVLDALHIFRNGLEVGVAAGPFGTSGRFTLPLGGLLLQPTDTDTFAIAIDIEADAPPIGIEILVDADGIHAVDANLGSPLALELEPGESMPISSGVGRLEQPADELVVGFEDHMPAVIAGTGSAVHVADVSLTNTAPSEAGPILVEQLIVRAADPQGIVIDAGAGAASVSLRSSTSELALATLAVTDSVAALVPPTPIVIPTGTTLTLSLNVTFRQGASVPGCRTGFGANDLVVRQPDSGLITVRVEPEPGTAFPFWTEAGTFTPLSLDESYSNFPNPFAAGRETTAFVFALDTPARVTLRVFGPRGDGVVTLLDGDTFPIGLHQSTRWDGRNGRGRTVRNGVYIAELHVRFDDGRDTRLRRKVAVVR